MANIRFALGAEADLCTTDEMNEGINGLHSALSKGMERAKPIKRPLTASLQTVPKSNGDTAILKLGRPSSGRVWVLTRVTVMGDDDHTAVTALTAAVYIGDAAQASIGQCVQHGQAVPFTSIENERAWVCHDREDVFINFVATGATNNAGLVATALVWEYRDVDLDAQGI